MFKAKEIYFLLVLAARSLKLRCQREPRSPEDSRGGYLLVSSQLLVVAGKYLVLLDLFTPISVFIHTQPFSLCFLSLCPSLLIRMKVIGFRVHPNLGGPHPNLTTFAETAISK